MTVMSGLLVLGLLSIGPLAATAAAAQDRPAGADRSGAALYGAFCASCHGETGRGDGPVADLAPVRPPDLTMLSRSRGGVYPRREVREVLEGTRAQRTHAGGMPNWRDVIARTEGNDPRRINARLEAIVDHVETLQRTPPGRAVRH